jgi:hypothetical protein
MTQNTGKQNGSLSFQDMQTEISFKKQNTVQNLVKQHPQTNTATMASAK